jgi:hypothetical protein
MTLMGTLITLKKKTRRMLPKIAAFASRLLKITYYGYIQDIWELDYGVRMRIPVFRC